MSHAVFVSCQFANSSLVLVPFLNATSGFPYGSFEVPVLSPWTVMWKSNQNKSFPLQVASGHGVLSQQ